MFPDCNLILGNHFNSKNNLLFSLKMSLLVLCFHSSITSVLIYKNLQHSAFYKPVVVLKAKKTIKQGFFFLTKKTTLSGSTKKCNAGCHYRYRFSIPCSANASETQKK